MVESVQRLSGHEVSALNYVTNLFYDLLPMPLASFQIFDLAPEPGLYEVQLFRTFREAQSLHSGNQLKALCAADRE